MIPLSIEFSSILKNYIEAPKPSLQHIPLEYKKLQNFHTAGKETVKKCVPFLDSLTCGYIIPFPIDIRFRYDDEKQKAFFDLNEAIPQEIKHFFEVSSHNEKQISNDLRYVHRTVEAVFKFINTWKIKTPKGYSCIFTQPFNRNLPFKIIDGIVDTDTYPDVINFPFYWTNKVDTPFTMKGGSPMVLVIPFKRNSWKMKIKGNIEDPLNKINYFSQIFDNYRNKFWTKKEYR